MLETKELVKVFYILGMYLLGVFLGQLLYLYQGSELVLVHSLTVSIGILLFALTAKGDKK